MKGLSASLSKQDMHDLAHRVVVLNALNGRPTAVLIPLSASRVMLLWTVTGFDSIGTRTDLLVNLTDREAQKVFEKASSGQGLLEPVRRHLRDRTAIVGTTTHGKLSASVYVVSARGTADEFLVSVLEAGRRSESARKTSAQPEQVRWYEEMRDAAVCV